jgi:hypothetical protein
MPKKSSFQLLNAELRLGIGLGLALAGMVFFYWQTALWIRAAKMFDAEFRSLNSVKHVEAGPLFLEPDSYLWMTYARRIANGETWRVRWTESDNAPYGRAVHWSQSVSWGLVVSAEVRRWFHPHDAPQTNLEKASVWWNSSVYLMFAILVFITVGRSMGWWVGGAAVFVMSSLGDVLWAFQPLRPDHQTFHILFGFGSLLLLWGAIATREDGRNRILPERSWMWASAVLAGAGLWVSATVQTFFMLSIAGAGALALLASKLTPPVEGKDIREAARCWREWGVIAALASIFFYALEYAPDFPWKRLEVNHPLYALSALALGLGMAEGVRLKYLPAYRQSWSGWVALVLAAGMVALPLALLFKAPAEFHTIRHVEMLRFHNFIKEFYFYTNYIKSIKIGSVEHFFRSYGLLPFSLLVVPILFWQLRRMAVISNWLIGLSITTLGFLALGLFQIRWFAFFAVALALLSVFLLGVGWQAAQKHRGLRIVFILLTLGLLAQTLYFMVNQTREIRLMLAGKTVITDLVTPARIKYAALELAKAKPRPQAILADPNYAPAMAYFAGIPTVVSFYWENLEGLRAATAIWASEDEDWETARKTLEERKITHVLMEPSDYLPNVFYFIRHGRYDLRASKKTLANKILYEDGPLWVRTDWEISSQMSKAFRYRSETIELPLLIFRVAEKK